MTGKFQERIWSLGISGCHPMKGSLIREVELIAKWFKKGIVSVKVEVFRTDSNSVQTLDIQTLHARSFFFFLNLYEQMGEIIVQCWYLMHAFSVRRQPDFDLGEYVSLSQGVAGEVGKLCSIVKVLLGKSSLFSQPHLDQVCNWGRRGAAGIWGVMAKSRAPIFTWK